MGRLSRIALVAAKVWLKWARRSALHGHSGPQSHSCHRDEGSSLLTKPSIEVCICTTSRPIDCLPAATSPSGQRVTGTDSPGWADSSRLPETILDFLL